MSFNPSSTTKERLAFIDLEASGLSDKSWPVEVGWAFCEGAASSILICPDEKWPDDAWSNEAEALHGLSRDHLRKEGVAARKVCAALNKALSGCAAYSDAPDWDGFWLYRLFDAAKVKQTFSVLNFADLVRRQITGREQEVISEANRLAPRRHRAADDALNLQMIYRLAIKSTD